MAKQQQLLTSLFPAEQSEDENFLSTQDSSDLLTSTQDLSALCDDLATQSSQRIIQTERSKCFPESQIVEGPLPPRAKRIKGVMYWKEGRIVIWSGKRWNCEHGRSRSLCKDCGGSSICEHGRQRSKCKDCDGASICQHGRRRSQCKDCGGASICEHGRQRSKCKDCGGTSICQHGRRHSQCKDCGGASICEHGRQRSQCKDCDGAYICEHGRQHSQCKDCGGASICEHGRRRSQCKDCDGASICQHDRRRSRCSDCGTGLCPKCGFWQTGGKLCATCDPSSKKRKRYDESRIEMKMIRFLQERVSWTILFLEQDFGSPCGYTNKKFDCVFFSRNEKFVIIIECDEECHNTPGYTEKCEWTRPFAACDIFEGKSVLFVRWNPDAWKVAGETIRVSRKEKMDVLWKTIQPYAEEAAFSSSSSSSSASFSGDFGALKVIFLYYPSVTQSPVHEVTKEELEEKMNVLFS